MEEKNTPVSGPGASELRMDENAGNNDDKWARIPGGDEDSFGFRFDGFEVQDSVSAVVKVLTGAMPECKRKLVDRIPLAYIKFPIPKPCCDGQESTRFWSSIIAKIILLHDTYYTSSAQLRDIEADSKTWPHTCLHHANKGRKGKQLRGIEAGLISGSGIGCTVV